MDRVKQKRGVLRAAITKLINEIDLLLQTTAPAADVLSTKLDILKSKEEMLQTLDQNIEESVPEEAFEQEVQGVLSYEEKICTAKSQITQKLRTYNRQLPRTDSSPSRVPHVQPTQNAAACRVRLPKIEISKFSGDLAEWTTFWDQFQSSIHTNESLHKVDKFRYLQSYLTGKAAAAISGLSLTNENYDTAIDLLKQRFNQRHLIVEEHLNRLLHLSPVVDAGKFVRLRELYDEVQVRVRSLQALDVGTKEYGIMLMSVLRKAVPREVTLEYNRKHKGAPSEGRTEVEDFMDFLKVEVESREKDTLLPDMQRNRAMNLDEPHSRTAPRDGRRLFERQTTGALTTGVTPQQLECLLCKAADHGIENCRSNLSVGDKKALLSREGRCFKCGKKYHRSRDCRTAPRLRCATCGGHHFTILCDRPGNYRAAEDPNPARLGVMASSALSTSDAAAATGPVLLQTARIWAETDRKRQFVRAMLDGGSQRTFIKESLSHELKCEPVGEEALSIFSFGCTPVKKTCRRVKVWLRSQYRRQDTCVEALETPEISANLMPSPDANVTRVLNEKGMEVADAAVFGTTCKPEVQILIGSDYYWAVVTGESQRISDKLFAVNTIFGWTVQGPNTSSSSCFNTGVGVLRVTVESTENEASVELQRFWDLEHIGIKPNEVEHDSLWKNEVLAQFRSSIEKKDRRYEVSLPWTDKKEELLPNLQAARTRLQSLTRRLMKDRVLMEEYDAAIRLYEQNGHAEKVPTGESDNVVYYMPHRAIIKRERETTKIRIVFDASSSSSNDPSLNDVLHAGPSLNPDMLHVMIKFRANTIALTADVEKAFLQIALAESDRDALRYLWYATTPRMGQPLPEIEALRMTRVPFGATSSPFLLAATLRHHFREMSDIFPSTCKILGESFYVDDLVTSVNTLQEARQLCEESVAIGEHCGMKLRKWATNDHQLREALRQQGDDCLSQQLESKVLGVIWDTRTDHLRVALRSVMDFLITADDTKRSLLQATARVFDPLGFLAPFVIRAKIMFQRVWQRELNWDDDLPTDVLEDWQRWRKELHQAKEIAIPRALKGTEEIHHQTLHVFCDASLLAYGAVVYLRTEYKNGACTVYLILAKARVAPLKRISLPRLELLGTLLGARLCDYVAACFPDRHGAILWSDSMIALSWIRGDAQRYKPFVANRISEIQSSRSISGWRHCPGEQNPADLLTRGSSIHSLHSRTHWWEGPQWLKESQEQWPSATTGVGKDISEEVRATHVLLLPSPPTEPILQLTNCSSLDNVVRTTAWIYRFLHNSRRDEPTTGPLSTCEIRRAENYWIRQVQAESFSEELEAVKSSWHLKVTSKLRDLHPYLDKDGILRITGRLQRGEESEEVKHPIVLPKDHRFTQLLIVRAHRRLLHSGVRDTLVELRELYWIIQARQAVKKELYKCHRCRRQRARPAFQETAPLPPDRITRAEPFEVTGVDFAGPLFYKAPDVNSKKCYIALFTCAVTRAVHLEIVDDLTTQRFLMAFRRFVSRRGLCKVIYSDNALTFKRASKDLNSLWKSVRHPDVLDYLSQSRIQWKFIVERAAWWGGFWERLVRTVKDVLRRSLAKALLRHDELVTVLTEVEAIINSRPLTSVCDSAEDLSVLTPSHFLIGRRLTALPAGTATPTTSDSNTLIKSYRYREQLLNSFWNRWRKDYVLQLRSNHVVKSGVGATLKPGDLVLLVQERLPRHLWQVCRVNSVIPGADRRVRVCIVRLPSGALLRRPVQLLCPLEIV
ncbi:uncharacterized protein LOC135398613 [Ornithodoros turicata]|uniref:uncharacterized protein LOC135398613 n=1 Tax=Ornithodoros turicata TaxID=34597 RepID=UPI0031386C69